MPGSRLYRLLLRLLPRDFREGFGGSMAADLEARLREGGGGWKRGLIPGKALLDLAAQAAVLWTHELREWRTSMGRGLTREIRYALRALRGTPVFTTVALVTLALGVGANTAVFSVVRGVLLRPLPYSEPGRLLAVWPETNFNLHMVRRIREGVPAFAGVSGFTAWEFTLAEDEPVRLQGAVVSADHFRVLGVEPALGRTFRPGEEGPGNAGVVVLSHGLWVRRYGADPNIIGRTIPLSGHELESRTVIGVLPESHLSIEGRDIDVWVPFAAPMDLPLRGDNSWYVNTRVARLAPGATAEAAAAELRRVARSLRDEAPDLSNLGEEQVSTASVRPLLEDQVGEAGRPLWILLGAVGLVFLIACGNVANLILARGEARRGALAVRLALGAGRARLIQQLLLESTLLAALGGGAGVALAAVGVRALTAMAPADFPRTHDVRLDGAVLAFGLVVSLGAAMLVGLVPALRASRGDPAAALKSGAGRPAGRSGPGSVSQLLVGLQMAVALVLAVGAGLMVRSFGALLAVDPGFLADGVLAARVSIPEGRYASGDEFVGYYQRVLRAIDAVPGVEGASAIHLLPMTSNNWSFPTSPEGFVLEQGAGPPSINFRVVYPDYFDVMGIATVRGRTQTAADGPDDERVMVVNRAFAERFWPGQDPLEKHVVVFPPSGTSYRVVGMVADVRQFALDHDPVPEMYLSHAQWPSALSMWLLVRTAGDPLALAAAVRDAVWSVDAPVPFSDVSSLDQVVGRTAGATRFTTFLLSVFGGLALVLGLVGVYGVTAYTMARRVPEFGLRVALGAPRATVLASAVASGIAPMVLGLVLGGIGAWWSAGVLESLLFQVAPRDPLTLAAAALGLAATGMTAILLPAWRASGVDPARVLREE